MSEAAGRIAALLLKADEVRKAAASRRDPAPVREQLARLLTQAREHLDEVDDEVLRLELAGGIARRVADLDHEEVATMLGPSPDVAVAPTSTEDPDRVPPGQHLTAGFGTARASTSATRTPVQVLSSRDHVVTQWKSRVRSTLPRAWSCPRSRTSRCDTSPVTVTRTSSTPQVGARPTCSTGKPAVRC